MQEEQVGAYLDWDQGYQCEKKPKSPYLISVRRPNVLGSGFGF